VTEIGRIDTDLRGEDDLPVNDRHYLPDATFKENRDGGEVVAVNRYSLGLGSRERGSVPRHEEIVTRSQTGGEASV
jgi:hypothetical protein